MAIGMYLAALAVMALGIWYHAQHEFGPMDTYFPPNTVNNNIETHFSDTYYQARALFREHAATVNAKLHTLPLEGYEHLDLTIDVAVIEGSKERVVMHISGTHGVEGFAGSAIQSAVLKRMQEGVTSAKKHSPTLIFVHALNPYGFSQLRRFNENNVDLNRNFLSSEAFKNRIAKGSNSFGYDNIRYVLNPPNAAGWTTWLNLVVGLVKNGVSNAKRAIVSGNYHYPNTIFYGGNKQQPSVAMLQRFLETHLDYDALKFVGVIDVHTGLGPPGHDTLLMDISEQSSKALEIFKGGDVEIHGANAAGAGSGYDGVEGLLCRGMEWFLPSKVQLVCLTQEFGTAPGFLVLKAMVEENAMYHHAPSRRLPYSEKLRDVFYLHRSFQWKKSIIERGLKVFDQLVDHTATVA